MSAPRPLRLSAAALDALRRHAAEGYPHEVVGILAGPPDDPTRPDTPAGPDAPAPPTGPAPPVLVDLAVPLVNERADSPRNRYIVSGLMLMKAERAVEAGGRVVRGYYHTHPDHPATYSDYDRDHALPNLAYAIQSVLGGGPETATEADPGRGPAAVTFGPLLCWTLREDRSAMDPVPMILETGDV